MKPDRDSCARVSQPEGAAVGSGGRTHAQTHDDRLVKFAAEWGLLGSGWLAAQEAASCHKVAPLRRRRVCAALRLIGSGTFVGFRSGRRSS